MTKAVTLAELADQNVLTALDNKVGIATTNPQSTLQVGAGITMDGNAGVITAKFSGDGSGLIGVASTDNIITGTAATFNNVVKVGTGITMDSASGIITATSFVKSGGTPAQYLMADGTTTEGDSLTKGYIAGLSAFLN